MKFRFLRTYAFCLVLLAPMGIFSFLPTEAHAEIVEGEVRQYPIGPQPLLAVSDKEGDVMNFFVDPSYDLKNRSSIAAQHLLTGQHAYLYMDKTYLDTLTPADRPFIMDEAQKLLVEFDNHIYPIITDTFGTPWEPGSDGDLRITILFTQLTESTAGYFNPRDEFERANVPESNQREMIYLNTRFLPAGRSKMFLAHEFQHLISFYWKDKLLGKSDDVWLNEARSEYTPTLLGYDAIYNGSNLEHRVGTFLRNPSDSLTEWRNTPADYGPVSLFAQYLGDHYSGTVFREMMRARSVGFSSVEDALTALGQASSFSSIFSDWTVANYLNDISVNPKFGYLNPRLRSFSLPLLEISSVTASIAFSIKDWSNVAYHLSGDASGSISFAVSAGERPAAFSVEFIRIENGTVKLERGSGGDMPTIFNAPLSAQAAFLILPHSQLSLSGFGENEPSRSFLFIVKNTPIIPPTLYPQETLFVPRYPEGALIRARGDYKVYITKGQFRRHVVGPDIFRFYGHLGFAQVIDVSAEELAQYKPSAWVRVDGDTKVWEINGDGTKHWINIPGEQFVPGGRDWNGVYIINERERNWYIQGVDVLK